MREEVKFRSIRFLIFTDSKTGFSNRRISRSFRLYLKSSLPLWESGTGKEVS